MNAYREGPRHNPDVEAQRPGYCLELVVFPRAGQEHGPPLFLTGMVTWGRPQDAIVFASLDSARIKAAVINCIVTTVPRFNGFCREWEYR